MVRVAVCFTDQDAGWADHVSQWAALKGYDVDRLANDVLLGSPSALRLHLVEADALLVIVTPAWVDSPACTAVFREAHLLRRPVFPLIVSTAGALIIGSDLSRLTLSDSEAVGLEMLAAAIETAAAAAAKHRPTYRFCAFISYSHKDKAQARRLHRAIESYRMPQPLVGKTTAFGKVGRALGKAFRDDEELRGASDLGSLIQGALDESETLVVICSPHAAQSPYVNKEIETFKLLGKESRIVPVIIAGRPHDPSAECFPAALGHKAGKDGHLSSQPAEPIGVDVRVHGKRRTLLKVIAGITGVEFDELEQRERRRRKLRARLITASMALILVALLATGAVIEADSARQALIARAARVLPERQPLLAAQLALASLPKASDLWRQGEEAAPTLKASGYAFATRILDPEKRFYEAILTSDGKQIITRGYGNIVSIWDVQTGTRVADLDFTYYGGPATFEFLQLAPDETRLLAWNPEGPLELWDAQNGKWIAELGPDQVEVGVKFSADGNWIAVPFSHESAALFNAHSGERAATFSNSRYVEVSADGSRVVTKPAGNETAALWEGHSGRRIADVGTVSGLFDLKLSPDGSRMVVNSGGKSAATLWDAVSGRPIAELGGQGAAYRFEMSRDGKRIATLRLGGEVLLWDSADGRRISRIGPENSSSVRFSENGDFVVVFSPENLAFVSDAQTGAAIGEIGQPGEGAGGLYFIPNSDRVALLTRSIGLVLRDIHGALIAQLANDNDAYDLAVSQDGRLIQAKDANHWVKLWDGRTGQLIGALAGPREGHRWMIDRNNLHAVTVSIDGTLRLRRLDAPLDADPAALRDYACRENRDVIGAFPPEERSADTPVGLALRGRPWHPCDWRGLGSPEGWLQLMRYWATRAGLPWDYEPPQTTALPGTHG